MQGSPPPLAASIVEDIPGYRSRLVTGDGSPVSFVEDALARAIGCSDLNLLCHLDERGARQLAKKVDSERSDGRNIEGLPPLAGIPFLVKDNIAVAGMPLTGGGCAIGGGDAAADAPVVAALRKAGAIPIGKANLHEFAFGVTSDNPIFGPVRNPANRDFSTGGSSGGSAAAVAAGVVPFALGTDTGGSGRIPAAFCGCVGFRPSAGRYPAGGVLTLSWTLDTISLAARTVSDVALLDTIIVPDGRSPPDIARPLRLGVPRSSFAAQLEGQVDEAFDAVLARLAASGVILVDVDCREILKHDEAASFPIAIHEAGIVWRRFLEDRDIALRAFLDAIASPDVRAGFQQALESAVVDSEYGKAMHLELLALRDRYASCFLTSRIDGLVFPTVPVAPPPLGENETVSIGDRKLPLFPTIIRNTSPGSLGGLPGISIPAGKLANGLPFGVEIDGPVHEDRALLKVAERIEEVLA